MRSAVAERIWVRVARGEKVAGRSSWASAKMRERRVVAEWKRVSSEDSAVAGDVVARSDGWAAILIDVPKVGKDGVATSGASARGARSVAGAVGSMRAAVRRSAGMSAAD